MTDRQLTAALAGSAAAAAALPSEHASPTLSGGRPWRWVVHTDSLDLFADRGRVFADGGRVFADRRRVLTSTNPTDRVTLINCGDALHRARVALAADGRAARVTLLPDANPDHVATLTAPEHIDITDDAKARYAAARRRPGDRRLATGARPADTAIAALLTAAAAEGTRLHLLGRDQVIELAAATAVTRRALDWIRQDATSVYGVLAGDGDSASDWVRAGEALSAVWLEATRHGLSIVPSTALVEIATTGKVIRRLLPPGATPYLALRIGVSAPPAQGGPP